WASLSTKVQWAAPRDSASTPSPPLPAKASSTRASTTAPRLSRALNVASLTRSAVGRVPSPGGPERRMPRADPATTRTAAASQVAPPPTTVDPSRFGPMTDAARDVPDGVVVIRIGRPERRNAIDSATAERLHDELIAFDSDPSRRVAVLTGDEQAF